MAFPSKLKNYTVFADGDNYMGLAEEITLPPLKEKVETYRGGGMLAEVDVPMGLEKMEMSVKFGGLVERMYRTFGASGLDVAQLRYVGAYQEDGAGLVKSAELVVRGRHVEIDHGTAKVADKTEMTVKSTLSYLKWTISGREIVEIDVLGNVFRVYGIDRMAGIRAAMGL